MKIIVAVPIWGEGYVSRFLKYALPSLRQPGNLPALAAAHDVEIVLYTSHEDAIRLAGGVSNTGLNFRIEPLASLADPFFAHCHGGTMMKDLFQRGFDLAWGQQAAFVPVCADAVYSDGFFASAAHLVIDEGYRAAMTQGAGVNVETIGPALRMMTGDDGIMRAPPRDLMAAFMSAVRHGLDLPTWPGTQLYPAQFFTPFQGGAVMRCCHMYVAMIRAHRHAVMQYSPDNDLAEKVLNSPADIGWLTDSDNGFFFGLAVPLHASLQPACPQGSQNVSPEQALQDFCRYWVSPWKYTYFDQHVVWHDGAYAGSEGGLVAAMVASDAVVAHIQGVYREIGGVTL